MRILKKILLTSALAAMSFVSAYAAEAAAASLVSESGPQHFKSLSFEKCIFRGGGSGANLVFLHVSPEVLTTATPYLKTPFLKVAEVNQGQTFTMTGQQFVVTILDPKLIFLGNIFERLDVTHHFARTIENLSPFMSGVKVSSLEVTSMGRKIRVAPHLAISWHAVENKATDKRLTKLCPEIFITPFPTPDIAVEADVKFSLAARELARSVITSFCQPIVVTLGSSVFPYIRYQENTFTGSTVTFNQRDYFILTTPIFEDIRATAKEVLGVANLFERALESDMALDERETKAWRSAVEAHASKKERPLYLPLGKPLPSEISRVTDGIVLVDTSVCGLEAERLERKRNPLPIERMYMSKNVIGTAAPASVFLNGGLGEPTSKTAVQLATQIT